MGWVPDHIWAMQQLMKKGGKGGKGGRPQGLRKGGKGGKSSGGMGRTGGKGWLPDHIWLAQKLSRSAVPVKKNLKHSMISKQKVQFQAKNQMDQKTKEKLQKIDPELKVWVGGLSENVTWKQLLNHFKEAGKPQLAEVLGKKGTGCVAYKTTDDVANAIATLDGSELGGNSIEVGAWEKGVYDKKERTEEEKQDAKKKRKTVVKQVKQVKQATKRNGALTPAEEKLKEKMRETDPSLKVWVGGLNKDITWKDLEKHFVQASKPKLTDINTKGTAGVCAFKTEDEAATAISVLNGSTLKGCVLEVDVFTSKAKE